MDLPGLPAWFTIRLLSSNFRQQLQIAFTRLEVNVVSEENQKNLRLKFEIKIISSRENTLVWFNYAQDLVEHTLVISEKNSGGLPQSFIRANSRRRF